MLGGIFSDTNLLRLLCSHNRRIDLHVWSGSQAHLDAAQYLGRNMELGTQWLDDDVCNLSIFLKDGASKLKPGGRLCPKYKETESESDILSRKLVPSKSFP